MDGEAKHGILDALLFLTVMVMIKRVVFDNMDVSSGVGN